MEPFIFNSTEFQKELDESPHLAGEVHFLAEVAEPGMLVIDAGAHRGVTAVTLAKSIGSKGHVYVFEPVPEYYVVAEQNLIRNHVENVTLYQEALGKKSETVPFYIHGGGSGIVKTDDTEVIQVSIISIDEFMAKQSIERIDVLSLDLEGSELFAFQGAETLLKNQQPIILCEIHHSFLAQFKLSVMQVAEYLQKFGYEVKPLQMDTPEKVPSFWDCSHIGAWKPSKNQNSSFISLSKG